MANDARRRFPARPTALAPALVMALAGSGCGGKPDEVASAAAPPPDPVFVTVAECRQVASASIQMAAERSTPNATVGATNPLTVRLNCGDYPEVGKSTHLKDASVTWTVLEGFGAFGGGATVAPTSTDADGLARVAWTLGPLTGPQKAEARFESNAVLFTVTATARNECDPANGGTDHGSPQITADTTWTAAAGPHRGTFVTIGNGATLTIEAGSVVCVEQSIDSITPAEGRFDALGTASKPVRFVDTRVLAAARRLEHVVSTNAEQVGRGDHLVTHIADSTFSITKPTVLGCPQVFVGGSNGAAIERSRIDGYGSATCPALHLLAALGETVRASVRVVGSMGDGVFLAGNGSLILTDCEVTASGRHGVFVFHPNVTPPAQPPTAVSVNGCNLFGNSADAIHNDAPLTVDATNNWWGDPTGALGGLADGVSGLINVGGFFAAPVVLGY
jgi:hypothetical protein